MQQLEFCATFPVMSNGSDSGSMYLAPGASRPDRFELPGAGAPPPDEHVVEPETYREMVDGQVIEVAPAEPPHADCQFDMAYVLRAHVADGYVGSTELLTRVSEHNDFATDACIRKRGTDTDGHRYLEELSFEIKHKQSEASLRKRARYLIERGVRRVFAIYAKASDSEASSRHRDAGGHVTAGPVKEWSAGDEDWIDLARDSYITDRCLRSPVKVRALIEAVEADNAVARALIDRDNPVIVELKANSYSEGKSDGLQLTRQAIRALCQALDVALGPAREARLETSDADQLQAVLDQLREHRSWNLK